MARSQHRKRIRIDTAVAVAPFNHSRRMASNFAMIDILSHGRLDFGIGRLVPARAEGAMWLAAARVLPYLYTHHVLIGLRSRD